MRAVMQKVPDRLAISIKTGCQLADVSENLLRREIRTGKLKARKTGPGPASKVLIDYQDFLRWLRMEEIH